MNSLEKLLACAGVWHGTNLLQVSPDCAADESPSTVTVTPLLGGRFVRIEQNWAWQGSPQEGSLLIGYGSDSNTATGHWIDSFHNGHKVMACRGAIDLGGAVNVLGGYAAPPGPDWGWRITIAPQPPNRLDIVMYNIDPSGNEVWAVKAEHTPG